MKPLLLTGSPTGKTIDTCLNAKLDVVHFAHTAPGHSQKNEISPGAAGCSYKKDILKPVKSVSCVTPLSYVNPVLNVTNLPVGARLQKFWKNWLDLGADKLGNSTLNISKDENLTRLLDSFHRDRPRAEEVSPPGTYLWFYTS